MGSTKETGTPARRCEVSGMLANRIWTSFAPLPRTENVSKMPFWPVAPTPGTRVTRSWKSEGAATASRS
jgi:hypothetical protein